MDFDELKRRVWPPCSPQSDPHVFGLIDTALSAVSIASAAVREEGATGLHEASGGTITTANLLADLVETERALKDFRSALPEADPLPTHVVPALEPLGPRFRRAADVLAAAAQLDRSASAVDAPTERKTESAKLRSTEGPDPEIWVSSTEVKDKSGLAPERVRAAAKRRGWSTLLYRDLRWYRRANIRSEWPDVVNGLV